MKQKMTSKGVLPIMLLLGFLSRSMAQEINLNPEDRRNKQTVVVKLFDNNEGGYLLDLPLTFHLNPDHILFMIVGDENELGVNNSVWMFDRSTDLNQFLKLNKNVATTKTFQKQNPRLTKCFDQSANIEIFASFDKGFESVQASPKPVFFRIMDPARPVQLKLKFYVALEKNDGTRLLTAEAGTIKITVNLQKNNLL